MIPIGAPVSFIGLKEDYRKAIIVGITSDFYLMLDCNAGHTFSSYPFSFVKIRYDDPAPFTLWQLNALEGVSANCGWQNLESEIIKRCEKAGYELFKLRN